MKTRVLIICYGAGGSEGLNPVHNYYSKLDNYEVECISLSDYASKRLTSYKRIEEGCVIDYIKDYKPNLVLNECSSGLDIQNKITKYCTDNNILNIKLLDIFGGYEARFKNEPNIILSPSYEVSCELENCISKDTEVFTVGNPAFDSLRKTSKIINRNEPNIVFISQPLVKYGLEPNEFKVFKHFYELVNTTFSEYNLSIKLHPEDDRKTWETFISKFTNVSIIDIDGESFMDSMYDYDLVLGYDSTLMFKTTIMEIPTIYYNQSGDILKFLNNKIIEPKYAIPKSNALENIINLIEFKNNNSLKSTLI